MNIRAKIASILSLLILWGGLDVAWGQVYASAQLKRLAEHTNLSIPKKDGIYYKVSQYNGLPLTVIINNGEVCHIGLSLFTPWQRQFIDETHCNFLERLSLATEIPEFYGISARQYLKDEKVEFLEGRLDDIRAFTNDTTHIFQSTLVDGKTYIACWYDSSGQERRVTLIYPADFQLISGLSMVEAENRLYDDIRRTRLDDTEQFEPVEDLLQPIGNGPVHLLKGSIFFLPELNSNRYYVKESAKKFSLLYSEDFPLETLANLVTGTELENQFNLEIRLVKYGFQVDNFTVPLQYWLAFCIQSGCTPYFGVIKHEEHQIVGELIMQNEALGYCHVMKITLDPSILKGRKGTIKARLNSYVPMSNVKSLFDENN